MLKTKTKVKIGFVSILSLAAGVQASSLVASQVAADTSKNTTFQVNVVESLSVSLTTPNVYAKGGINTFLRNAVNLTVTSNNAKGFTASMYSNGSTNLSNTSADATIPTLGSSCTQANFPANYWGYSLDDTANGNENSNYNSMVSTAASPITILSSSSAATGTQDIYFGAKADASKAAGTYSGTVLISVVTGTIDPDTNPTTPTNPVTPDTDTPDDNAATYTGEGSTVGGSTNGTTAYTTTNSDATAGTTTTTTEISSGDTRNSYRTPQGVIEDTTSNINTGTPLATGLAVTAGVAAASGIFFFILAKRKKDDEDEEEQM